MGFSVVVVFISWNMPLFKVWSEDKLDKKILKILQNLFPKESLLKRPVKCGFSKKHIFIEIKNLRKIALDI